VTLDEDERDALVREREVVFEQCERCGVWFVPNSAHSCPDTPLGGSLSGADRDARKEWDDGDPDELLVASSYSWAPSAYHAVDEDGESPACQVTLQNKNTEWRLLPRRRWKKKNKYPCGHCFPGATEVSA